MKRKTKKLLSLFICICLMLSTASCGHDNASEISELSAETSQEEKKQNDKEAEEAVKNLEKMKDTSDKVKDVSGERLKESVSE